MRRRCWSDPGRCLRGSPPLAFTFGLGGLAIFPLRFGAAATLLEHASPPNMIEIIQTYRRRSVLPRRRLIGRCCRRWTRARICRRCASRCRRARRLPGPIFEEWMRKTGKPILDGIGSTEMLHIFITNRVDDMAPGTTGHPVSGYQARVVDDDMNEVPRGTVGHLAVRGPTGCRYLADSRQRLRSRRLEFDRRFVRAGRGGGFHFTARSDDMIISCGYNIAGPRSKRLCCPPPRSRNAR